MLASGPPTPGATACRPRAGAVTSVCTCSPPGAAGAFVLVLFRVRMKVGDLTGVDDFQLQHILISYFVCLVLLYSLLVPLRTVLKDFNLGNPSYII